MSLLLDIGLEECISSKHMFAKLKPIRNTTGFKHDHCIG